MILTVSAVSIAAYIFLLFKFRKNLIQQQVAFLIVFLVGLTILGNLDVLLPIYFIISLIPFVLRIRKISNFTGILCVYFLVYLIYGLINQNFTGTVVTFITKMWQFIIFFIVCDTNIAFWQTDYKKTIGFAVLAETLLGLYLFNTSTNINTMGIVRLVYNAQPISGNISIVILPIVAFYYIENRNAIKNTRWLLWMNIIMLTWVVLSGTRGYTLVFAMTMVPIFYDYFTNDRVGRITLINRIFTFSALVIASLLLVFVVPNILDRALLVLRLKSSIGIRVFENAAIIEYAQNSPLLTMLFGIGLGGTGGSYSALANALSRQFSLGMWHSFSYMNNSGALFHNLYANVFLCLGLLGTVMIALLNIMIWKRITQSCGTQILARNVLHLYQIGFLLMNYYRWSAVCGIAEMVVFALVLKAIDSSNKKSNEFHDKRCIPYTLNR